jgi:ethanolamine utilization protein EutQ (cupin superfamily)
MLRDFELMKNNAIRFNGANHPLSIEANAIYEFVKSEIADNRQQLDMMEEAVRDQMSSKKSKKAKAAQAKMAKSSEGGFNAVVDGVAVNLGNLSKDAFDNSDSDDSA